MREQEEEKKSWKKNVKLKLKKLNFNDIYMEVYEVFVVMVADSTYFFVLKNFWESKTLGLYWSFKPFFFNLTF